MISVDLCFDSQTTCAVAMTKYPLKNVKKKKVMWCIYFSDFGSSVWKTRGKWQKHSYHFPLSLYLTFLWLGGGWALPRSRLCGRTSSLPVIFVLSRLGNLTNYTLPWPGLAGWPGFPPVLTTHIKLRAMNPVLPMSGADSEGPTYS